MNIGEKIKLARMRLGISQGQLAQLIDISGGTLANYEQGRRRPSLTVAYKLSVALDIPFEELTQTAERGGPNLAAIRKRLAEASLPAPAQRTPMELFDEWCTRRDPDGITFNVGLHAPKLGTDHADLIPPDIALAMSCLTPLNRLRARVFYEETCERIGLGSRADMLRTLRDMIAAIEKDEALSL